MKTGIVNQKQLRKTWKRPKSINHEKLFVGNKGKKK